MPIPDEVLPTPARALLPALGRTIAGFVTLTIIGAAGCSAFRTETSEYLAQHARSPGQHQALSQRYRQEAERDRRLAASHQFMAGLYTSKTPEHYGSTVDVDVMAAHCKTLATAYEAAASEADALAGFHENAARAMSVDGTRRADGSLKQ